MIRYRWIEAAWPFDMKTLANRLRENTFTSAVYSGFILDRTRLDTVEGRFIERVKYSESIVDPLGGEQFIERLEFRIVKFKASSIGVGLELNNVPRSTSAFINAMSIACDYSLSLRSVNVDPLLWGEAVGKIISKNYNFISIQLSKIELADAVNAQVIISGRADVRTFLDKVTLGNKHIIDKVKIEIDDNNIPAIVLGRHMTVSSAGEIPTALLDAIRDAIEIAKI
jgi:hypothetical protein